MKTQKMPSSGGKNAEPFAIAALCALNGIFSAINSYSNTPRAHISLGVLYGCGQE